MLSFTKTWQLFFIWCFILLQESVHMSHLILELRKDWIGLHFDNRNLQLRSLSCRVADKNVADESAPLEIVCQSLSTAATHTC